jgi:hypothetical protein
VKEEDAALDKFRKLLGRKGGAPAEVEAIMARAVILHLDLEHPDSSDAERARLLLDGRVTPRGEGSKAWRELVDLVGEAARLRFGRSIESWLGALRDRQIPLLVDRDASHSAYLESQRQAVERYREMLQRRGSYVDLTGVGARLKPIPLAEMDAGIGVRRPESDRSTSGTLLWSLRRLGRAVLTGLTLDQPSTNPPMTFSGPERGVWHPPPPRPCEPSAASLRQEP